MESDERRGGRGTRSGFGPPLSRCGLLRGIARTVFAASTSTGFCVGLLGLGLALPSWAWAAPCAHDVSIPGEALDPLCDDPCAATVCDVDSTCCSIDWDLACVSLADSECGPNIAVGTGDENVVGSSPPEGNRDEDNLINGSGLVSCPQLDWESVCTGRDGLLFVDTGQPNGNNWNTTTDPADITFDLGAVYRIDFIHIWNFNDSFGNNEFGPESIDLLVSDSGTNAQDADFSEAPIVATIPISHALGSLFYLGENYRFNGFGLNDLPPELNSDPPGAPALPDTFRNVPVVPTVYHDFSGVALQGRFVRLGNLDGSPNFGGRTGLSEVRFYGEFVSEPPTGTIVIDPDSLPNETEISNLVKGVTLSSQAGNTSDNLVYAYEQSGPTGNLSFGWFDGQFFDGHWGRDTSPALRADFSEFLAREVSIDYQMEGTLALEAFGEGGGSLGSVMTGSGVGTLTFSATHSVIESAEFTIDPVPGADFGTLDHMVIVIPEPGRAALAGAALAMLGILRHRQRRAAESW